MSCCQGKPVSLNHKNKGTLHLADDITLRNEEGFLTNNFAELKKTIVVNKSTRESESIETTVTTIS